MFSKTEQLFFVCWSERWVFPHSHLEYIWFTFQGVCYKYCVVILGLSLKWWVFIRSTETPSHAGHTTSHVFGQLAPVAKVWARRTEELTLQDISFLGLYLPLLSAVQSSSVIEENEKFQRLQQRVGPRLWLLFSSTCLMCHGHAWLVQFLSLEWNLEILPTGQHLVNKLPGNTRPTISNRETQLILWRKII